MGANFIEIPVARVDVITKSTGQRLVSLTPDYIGPYIEESLLLYNKFIEMFEFRGSIVKKEVV